MSLKIKFMLLVLVLSFSALLILKRPDGQPWLAFSALPTSVNDVKTTFNNAVTGAQRMAGVEGSDDPNFGKTAVYKWRDSAGNWHLSDRPIGQAGGRDELLHIDPNTNLIEGVEVSAAKSASEVEQSRLDEVTNAVPLPMTVSPDKVSKLIDDAKAVQSLMDNRTKQLDGMQSDL